MADSLSEVELCLFSSQLQQGAQIVVRYGMRGGQSGKMKIIIIIINITRKKKKVLNCSPIKEYCLLISSTVFQKVGIIEVHLSIAGNCRQSRPAKLAMVITVKHSIGCAYLKSVSLQSQTVLRVTVRPANRTSRTSRSAVRGERREGQC